MSKTVRRPSSSGTPGSTTVAFRPGLVPANPLSVTKALLQVVVLLGIPLLMLLAGKILIRSWFPDLGY